MSDKPIHEDALPKMPRAIYDALYPFSWVDGVRLFPAWSEAFVNAALSVASVSEEWAVAWRNKAIAQAARIEELEAQLSDHPEMCHNCLFDGRWLLCNVHKRWITAPPVTR